MKKLAKSIVLYCFLFSVTGAFSQNSNWLVYSSGDEVNCQSVQGNYAWVGTDGGIVKINISTGETDYLNTGNSGLQQNNVQCLEVDRDGNVWVGNLGTNPCGGLSSFQDNEWTYYNPPPNYKKYRSITACENDNVWVSTSLSGLFHKNNSGWEVFDMNNSSLPTNCIGQVREEDEGDVWVVVHKLVNIEGCLARYDGERWEIFNTSNSGIPSNVLFSLDIDSEGNKWIGTDNGLVVYDGSEWGVYNTENSEIPSNTITAVACDTNNHIWAGTYNSGLARFDGDSWTLYKDTNSILPNNRIQSLEVDDNNTVWIINELGYVLSGRVISFDGSNWAEYATTISPLPNNTPVSLALDPDSSVWVGTNDGFTNIKDGAWTLYTTQNTPLEDDDIRAIACEKGGTKWFGALFYGLIKYDGNQWKVYTKENSQLPSRQFNCITIDKNNTKWIGMSSGGIDHGGLLKISMGNIWTLYNSGNSGLPNNEVMSVCVDTANIKWVGQKMACLELNTATGQSMIPPIAVYQKIT